MADDGWARSVLRGVALRCPACGNGRMFRSLVAMEDACPSCAVRFEPGRGEFTGAMMFGQGLLGTVALMGWFVLRVFADVPAWVELAWLLGFMLSPLVLYRNLKGAWVGVLHAARGLPKDTV